MIHSVRMSNEKWVLDAFIRLTEYSSVIQLTHPETCADYPIREQRSDGFLLEESKTNEHVPTRSMCFVQMNFRFRLD